jgi:hypothetical protein
MNRLALTENAPTCSDHTPLSVSVLAAENHAYRGSGGISKENRKYGFRPAFLDQRTGIAYLSCFANGCPAPLHMLDGLPETLVAERDCHGRVSSARTGVIAGFLCDDVFYTREQAARALAH